MEISRKRRRELRKLRAEAQEILEQQVKVLGSAGIVLKRAGQQAQLLGDEHLSPRVVAAYGKVRPAVDRGVASVQQAGRTIRVITAPLVARAFAKTLRVLEDIESPATDKLRNFATLRGYLPPVKRKRGGSVVAIVIGAIATAGVGYALWQAFRTDDELWVTGEE